MSKLEQFEEWMEKGKAAPFKDIIGGSEIKDKKAEQNIHEILMNQTNFMKGHTARLPEIKPASDAPTAKITGEALKPYIKEKHFKVFEKNGKPYAVGCVLCIYKGDNDTIRGDIREGYATVSPDDEFDEGKGKYLAYNRALNLDTSKPGKLARPVNKEYIDFIDKYENKYVCDIDYVAKYMFPLIRSVMPKVIANKYVKEFAEETDETSIKYIKK